MSIDELMEVNSFQKRDASQPQGRRRTV